MSDSTPMNAVIAVDGPAGAGKSTVAQRLAERLGGVRLDTGAIYRAVALVASEEGVSWEDGPALGRVASALDLRFLPREGGQGVQLGDRDITNEIRTPEVSKGASLVSQHAAVRAALMSLQRGLASGGRGLVVAEGRDMGTAVFPDAPVKFFLTASAEVRAHRRWEELRDAGNEQPFVKVLTEQRQRDRDDSERDESPLRQAPDAVKVDSTGLDIDQVVDHMAQAVQEALDAGTP
jgi:CMP/dCMP kinase